MWNKIREPLLAIGLIVVVFGALGLLSIQSERRYQREDAIYWRVRDELVGQMIKVEGDRLGMEAYIVATSADETAPSFGHERSFSAEGTLVLIPPEGCELAGANLKSAYSTTIQLSCTNGPFWQAYNLHGIYPEGGEFAGESIALFLNQCVTTPQNVCP